MWKLKRLILSLSMALALGIIFPGVGVAAEKKWEPLKVSIEDAKSIAKEAHLEILSMPSRIILNADQPVKIEIFTILGRLVSSESLPPGSYEFSVEVHGIYIIKVGDITCKIAL